MCSTDLSSSHTHTLSSVPLLGPSSYLSYVYLPGPVFVAEIVSVQPRNTSICGSVRCVQVRRYSFSIVTLLVSYAFSVVLPGSYTVSIVLGNAIVTVSLFTSGLTDSVSNVFYQRASSHRFLTEVWWIILATLSLQTTFHFSNSCRPFHLFRELLLVLAQFIVCGQRLNLDTCVIKDWAGWFI